MTLWPFFPTWTQQERSRNVVSLYAGDCCHHSCSGEIVDRHSTWNSAHFLHCRSWALQVLHQYLYFSGVRPVLDPDLPANAGGNRPPDDRMLILLWDPSTVIGKPRAGLYNMPYSVVLLVGRGVDVLWSPLWRLCGAGVCWRQWNLELRVVIIPRHSRCTRFYRTISVRMFQAVVLFFRYIYPSSFMLARTRLYSERVDSRVLLAVWLLLCFLAPLFPKIRQPCDSSSSDQHTLAGVLTPDFVTFWCA